MHADTTRLTDTPPPAAHADAHLIRLFRNGDETAATELFRRYAARVRALAAGHCNSNLGRRFDADDIVQTVFRTFFAGVRDSGYDAPPGGDIWRLLAVLAVNKARGYADHHRAAKRDALRTVAGEGLTERPNPCSDEGSAALLRLVMEERLATLPEDDQQVVRLRLEGHDSGTIAAKLERPKRTVERVIQQFRDGLIGDG
jgi:RNA polymerase sigma-70 factor (ECF subfamily)